MGEVGDRHSTGASFESYRHNFLLCISFYENTDFRANRLINSLLQ